MSSFVTNADRKKQFKLGAVVATAALATTFAGATAVHADTTPSGTDQPGQSSQTNQPAGFEPVDGQTSAVNSSSVKPSQTNAQKYGSQLVSNGSTTGTIDQKGSVVASSAVKSSAVASSAVKSASVASSAVKSSSVASEWKDTDVERHVVRTVRITTPNGRTQDYIQTTKLTRTKSEKDGKVVYSAWTMGEWKAFPLVPIDGYDWVINGKEYAPQKDVNGKYKSEELPAVTVTEKIGNTLVTISYKAVKNSANDNNAGKGPKTGTNTGSTVKGSAGMNTGSAATNAADAATTKTASLSDVLDNGAGSGTVTTTAANSGSGSGVAGTAPAGATVIGDGSSTGAAGDAQGATLPQTGQKSEAALAAMGAVGMLAALGFAKTGKKREM